MKRLPKSDAPSTIQRKLRLLRRLNSTLDVMLYLAQAHRIGPASALPVREQELDRAAEALAEALAVLTVRDRLPPEESRAPEPLAKTKKHATMKKR